MPTTLEENEKMTAQEMFNLSAKHLLTQKVRSVFGVSSLCAYRSGDGKMCAFGIFIPDSVYKPEMEGKAASAELIWDATHLPDELMSLARDLQFCHDETMPEFWKERLAKIASNYRLNSGALNEF